MPQERRLQRPWLSGRSTGGLSCAVRRWIAGDYRTTTAVDATPVLVRYLVAVPIRQPRRVHCALEVVISPNDARITTQTAQSTATTGARTHVETRGATRPYP